MARGRAVAALGIVVLLSGAVLAGCGVRRRAAGGAAAPAAPNTGALQAGTTSHTIDVDGTKRTYLTYVPASLDRSHPAPLVVMLHGGFGSAAQAEADYGWDAEADARGFVVVYPDGLDHAWNAGDCCGAPAKQSVDDVGFVTQAVAAVGKQVAIDPRRTFVTGMSNGAMMTERLACETHVFAAAASVAGAQMVPCTDPTPISMLHIHGLADSHVPFDGGPGHGLGNVPAHPPVADTIAAWRQTDGCAAPTSTTQGVVTTSAAACSHGRTVELITVEGAGHQWPGSSSKHPGVKKLLGADPPSTAFDATDLVWAFFSAHPAPA